eukprot:TRINITY_DN46948_c0_g1_i1.p1 TRINITY_DN46948_c0_g1~~TRINITY_DN46948_c0_g1_i1.p1  ORF type:complete len:112 (-),score=29.98 TRINITY_DN46948_c0_g1_i1:257-592(-)
MGRKRSAEGAAGAGESSAGTGGGSASKKQKKESEKQVSVTSLNNEDLWTRLQNLAAEIRETKANPRPNRRAQAVRYQEQRYIEAQAEYERRGLAFPARWTPPPLNTYRGGE